MKLGFFAACIVAVLFLSTNAFAQPHLVGKGEYVGPTAVSVPDPEFPEAAKESGIGGRISVNVKLNEVGNIISADDPTGPGNICQTVTGADVVALREAARSAALKGRFLPALRDGKPEASTLLLTFEFPESLKRVDKEKVYTAAAAAPPPDYRGPVITYSTVDMEAGSVEATRAKSASRDYSGMTISGGVLNGKAVSLPKPPYPAAARAIRASGAVNIQVLIDTDGSVFSADAVSGHPLLRQASRAAACIARFTPVLLSGTPVKIPGVITYNFVP